MERVKFTPCALPVTFQISTRPAKVYEDLRISLVRVSETFDKRVTESIVSTMKWHVRVYTRASQTRRVPTISDCLTG